jgi:hypothetical protein
MPSLAKICPRWDSTVFADIQLGGRRRLERPVTTRRAATCSAMRPTKAGMVPGSAVAAAAAAAAASSRSQACR